MSAKAFLECCFPTLHQRYQAKDRLGLKIHNFLPSPEQCLTIQNTETKIFRWASPWDYHRDLPRLGTKVRLSGVSRQQLKHTRLILYSKRPQDCQISLIYGQDAPL